MTTTFRKSTSPICSKVAATVRAIEDDIDALGAGFDGIVDDFACRRRRAAITAPALRSISVKRRSSVISLSISWLRLAAGYIYLWPSTGRNVRAGTEKMISWYTSRPARHPPALPHLRGKRARPVGSSLPATPPT
jgi:hypothetical protein